MNENGEPREKIVYSSGHYVHSDLQSHLDVIGMNFLDTAHWATFRQIQIGTRGFYQERYSTLERWLKNKCDRGHLRWTNYTHKIKAYAKKIKTRGFDPTNPD